MKKLTALTIAMIAAQIVFGQKMNATAYTEQSRGTSVGVSIGISNEMYYTGYSPVEFNYGVFLQKKTIASAGSETHSNKNTELSLVGLYGNVSVYEMNRLKVLLEIRAGIQNFKYFLIAPGVNANYKLNHKVSLQAGVSTRNIFMITYMAGISISL
jgi:hypothetical protein